MDYYILSLLCIVAIVYTIICSIRVKTTFNKYSKKTPADISPVRKPRKWYYIKTESMMSLFNVVAEN